MTRKITYARTCQNCRWGQFKAKADSAFNSGGRRQTGLCGLEADLPVPTEPPSLPSRAYDALVAATAETLPDLHAWMELKPDNPAYPAEWWEEIYSRVMRWHRWWKLNMPKMPRIMRTNWCEAWDGTETRFYREPKTKK